MPRVVPTGAPVYREFYFDARLADRAVKFFEKYLRHSKGEWAGKSFVLPQWQRDIVREIFGWLRIADGTRRYRTLYLEVPRKNGKSTFVAGLGLMLLTADGEAGAEIYSAAADKDQASIVFKEASEMVRQSPELDELCDRQTKCILVPSKVCAYRVLSADAFTKHGLNPHGILFDELHVQPNRELWDVLTTGVGARRQPLTVAATTAGHDKNTIGWEIHDYAVKVRDGIIDDPTFLAVIYAADEGDDWTSPATWKKANPNLGVTIKEEFLREQCEKAKAMSSYENTFKRLYLNIWTEQDQRWISVATWDSNRQELDATPGKRRCYLGLDLASTTDLACAMRVFPRPDGTFDVIPRYYVPRENVNARAKRDRVPYPVWIRDGYIVATEGNVIDYDFIKRDITEWDREHDLIEIGYDPWNATQLAVQLQGDGFVMVPVRQGYATLSPVSKHFEGLVLAGRIRHGGHPVLRWNISNAAKEEDAAGNIKPSKQKSREKIDGLLALLIGLSRATLSSPKKKSVYATRGMLTT